ncbi:hypothetical protein I215_08301 [Galbibacter marinus]|uniref:Secretion system C-terminal sorting domain-containing protein n=1 Tax=Galbibacter marinus TaxID=555500 RepID=K2Q335_9FLAO|nr:hypothetical protein [Galbibacter marinus]EKF55231.1 hypothetical protein I215_08301 [Galbibacter marinus]
MKNIIKRSLAVVVLSIATLASVSAKDFDMEVKKVDDRTVDLIIEKTSQPVDIAFVDANGVVLYKYSYKELPTSTKRYNFKDLPKGTYYFKVESATKIETIPVVVTQSETVINSDKKEITYKPHFRVDGDVVSINLLNIDESVVDIKVFDQTSNSLVHQEILQGKKSIGKRFDFSSVNDRRVYRLEVTHLGNTYYKTVSL